MRPIKLMAAAIGFSAALTGAAAAAPSSFVNPIMAAGADPWIVVKDGFYYFTDTQGTDLKIWKTRDIGHVADAPFVVAWRPPAQGPGSKSLWAPELHFLDGRWYLYFTASDVAHDDDAHRHIYVLENASADPVQGAWTFKGQLQTEHTGIDATVFERKGRLYFVYSAYVGAHSDLIVSAMANPWTLQGPQVDIAQPTYAWEMKGGRQILEAPEFLDGPGGQMFLTYSASACWADDYALGLLAADKDADPLDPKSWRKTDHPVFQQSPADHVYSTGHNGFFKSPDGQDWLVYHATAYPGANCKNRSVRIQPFSWTAEGRPDFGRPVASGVALPAPR